MRIRSGRWERSCSASSAPGRLAGEVFRETEGVDWISSIVVAAVLVLLLRAGTRRSLWGR